MPYFYFDLVVGEEFKDQGGMILEDSQIAFEKADSLASELYIVRPELRSRGCAVRLTDGENKELYRTPRGPQHAAARDTICPCGATLPRQEKFWDLSPSIRDIWLLAESSGC